MKGSDRFSKQNFLCPLSDYHGKFAPNTLVFNVSLQDFAHRVGYISSLHTGGKLSSKEAYQQVKKLWKQLKTAKS